MSINLMPFLWVALALIALQFLQRWIHRHLHGVSLLITGNKNWAVILYAIILFPGVLLHETSHWLTAKILRVRTGKFSVLPNVGKDGTIQLGYVEYYKTQNVGPIRESLIGAAPLLTGTAAVLLIALNIFDLPLLAEIIAGGDTDQLLEGLTTLFGTGDFLIWLYLIFAISNAMMPSASDRKAWPTFIIIMVLFAFLLYILGFTELFIDHLLEPATAAFSNLALAYSLATGVDIFFIFVIYVVEWLLRRLKGVDLIYGQSNN
jgi:hypothetical protein